MKIRAWLYAAPLFLAMYIGTGSHVVAGSALEVTQKPREISGVDRESGVAFAASASPSDHVVIDASIGGKQIHAEIDYKLKTVSIRSFSKANGTSVSLTAQDIVAFQKLRTSLLPAIAPAVAAGSRHGDALVSFVNLMASASKGSAINISSVCPPTSFKSICNEIGGPGKATYNTISTGAITVDVTVGPACYSDPALGRCGRSGGPDPGIGFVQRFTQECLNHDQCCHDAGTLEPFTCGANCVDEFGAAICGFFFAPDCATTAGNWTEFNGMGHHMLFDYVLTGGDGSGFPQIFTGTRQFSNSIWNVAGTRSGPFIFFTATAVATASLPAETINYSGVVFDCNNAFGSWAITGGASDFWAWKRTNTVGASTVGVGANAYLPSSSRGPVGVAPQSKPH
ncbi:MAG: hypothetical protein ACREDT_02850 [Methylocella sp.]